jgi:L-alanine-DL-glutamate epimerase-like enolase superfamily enzyme
MPKIASIEWFRVPPRWLFVKIVDEAGNVGWGEATLEGHTQAVEGALDAFAAQFKDFEAESVDAKELESIMFLTLTVILSESGSMVTGEASIVEALSS